MESIAVRALALCMARALLVVCIERRLQSTGDDSDADATRLLARTYHLLYLVCPFI